MRKSSDDFFSDPAEHKAGLRLAIFTFLLILFFFLSAFSGMQAQTVTVDNVSSLDGGQASQFTLSHTVGTNSDRFLIVAVSLTKTGSGKDVTSVTYGGTSMTQFENISASNSRVQLFKLVKPSSGTNDVVVDIEGSQDNKAAIGAISYYNVNQNTPTDTPNTTNGDASSSSLSVSSETDDMVMDVIATTSSISNSAVGSGQTLQYIAANESGTETGSSTEPGASSVSMDWNFSSSRQFNHVGFNINHASSGDTTPPSISNETLGASAGNLTFSFDSDEQLGSSASDVHVSVDGPNTSNVYTFDRNDFSETDHGSSFTYDLTASQVFNDGDGTYTAVVDTAKDSAGNNGGGSTHSDSYNYDSSTNTWESSTGGSPNDWSTSGNWSNGVPTSSQTITIPTDPQNNADEFPLLQSKDTVTAAVIKDTASVTVDTSYALTTTDSLTGNGQLVLNDAEAYIGGKISVDTVKAGDSNITLNGSSKQNISGLITADTLTITNTSSGGIVLSDSLTTKSFLDVSNSGSILDLTSGAAIDAHDIGGAGDITSTSASFYVSGDVTVDSVAAADSDVTFDGTSETQTVENIPEYQNLTVDNTHSSARVLSKSNVTVNGTLTLTNGDLIMASETNLIAPSRSLSGGKLRFQIELNNPGWYTISSPVASSYDDFLDSTNTQGFTGATYESDTLQPNVLYYKEYVGGTDNQHWRPIGAASDTIPEARGHYLYVFGDVSESSIHNNPTPDTLEVGGKEFDGDGTTVNFDVTYTDTTTSDSVMSRRGWNLVGNPYGATIDWDNDSKWTKTNMDSVIYVWDRDSNDYLTWNGVDGSLNNGLIAPFQGFWVKANGSSPALKIDNSAKTTGGDFYAKSQLEPASIAFKLKTDEADLEQQMHITLSSTGKYGKDARDAYRLLPFATNTYLTLYSTLDNGAQLSINNLPRRFGKKFSTPIHVGGFKKDQPLNGSYTLSWPEFGAVPPEWTIILKDKKTGKEINLRKRTFYSFTLSQSNIKKALDNDIDNFQLTSHPPISRAKHRGESRFQLVIKPGGEIAGIPTKYKLGHNYPNPFEQETAIPFAVPKKGPVSITIYDILGRKVRTLADRIFTAANHEVSWNPSELASGIYICVMRAGDKQYSEKITYIK